MDLSYESSPALAKQAARCFIWRRAGGRLIATGLIAVASIVALILGTRDWYVVVGIVLSALFLLGWIDYYQGSDVAFKSMPDPRVTIRLSDDDIKIETSVHKSTLKWSRIKSLWRFKEVWLLFTYSEDSYIVIPTASLPDEAMRLIDSKVSSLTTQSSNKRMESNG